MNGFKPIQLAFFHLTNNGSKAIEWIDTKTTAHDDGILLFINHLLEMHIEWLSQRYLVLDFIVIATWFW